MGADGVSRDGAPTSCPARSYPVEIDRERDEGLYVEPNVWMVHPERLEPQGRRSARTEAPLTSLSAEAGSLCFSPSVPRWVAPDPPAFPSGGVALRVHGQTPEDAWGVDREKSWTTPDIARFIVCDMPSPSRSAGLRGTGAETRSNRGLAASGAPLGVISLRVAEAKINGPLAAARLLATRGGSRSGCSPATVCGAGSSLAGRFGRVWRCRRARARRQQAGQCRLSRCRGARRASPTARVSHGRRVGGDGEVRSVGI